MPIIDIDRAKNYRISVARVDVTSDMRFNTVIGN